MFDGKELSCFFFLGQPFDQEKGIYTVSTYSNQSCWRRGDVKAQKAYNRGYHYERAKSSEIPIWSLWRTHPDELQYFHVE